MKRFSLLSTIIGLAVFGSTVLVPAQAFALTSGSLSVSGATQTSGDFVTTIYESADDGVNYADAEFSFSGASVSNVSVTVTAPFSATGAPCTATYCAIGGATGAGVSGNGNALATVRFTLTTPGTTTLSFDASSTLKHAVTGSTTVTTVHPAVSGASFTYNAPAPAPDPTPTPTPTSSTSSTPKNNAWTSSTPATTADAPSNAGTVAGDSTDKPKTTAEKPVTVAATTTKTSTDNRGLLVGLIIVLLAIIAGLYYWFGMRQAAVAVVGPQPAKYVSKKKTAAKQAAAKKTTKRAPTKKAPASKAAKKAVKRAPRKK